MNKLKTLAEQKNEISCQFTILRDDYEHIQQARAFNVGFDKAIEIVNKWNELRLCDSGEYESIGEPIPETNIPILFKKEGAFVFYFTGYFDGNIPIAHTNMVVTHWRYIEHP